MADCHVEIFFHMTDCHVEKFPHMRNVKKIYHIEKVRHMINVEQNLLCGKCEEICHKFVATNVVLLQNLFCRNLRNFFAINALLFGEKLNQTLRLCRKKDKNQVNMNKF